MSSKNIETLIVKYLTRVSNSEELDVLKPWIKEPCNYKVFKEMVKTHYAISHVMDNQDIDKFKQQLFQKIKENKSSRRLNKISAIFKYAAIFIIAVGVVYFFKVIDLNKSNDLHDDGNNSREVVLTLGNGYKNIILDKEVKKIVNDEGVVIAFKDGNEIDYSRNSYKINTLVYNELNVPYGKQFKIVLSDGSKVKLNAGSYIKYPIQFIPGQYREIFLKGEAYFEVLKDKKHPLIVNIDDLNVKVLGTKFNLSYYPEDRYLSAVLVEGSVQLYENKTNPKSSIFLTPGHKAIWRKENKKIKIYKVDTELYTSWIEGVLIFEKTSFKSIRKRLERRFNVSIQNNYEALDEQIYSASFDRGVSIEAILDVFAENLSFKYDVEKNNIIITKPNN